MLAMIGEQSNAYEINIRIHYVKLSPVSEIQIFSIQKSIFLLNMKYNIRDKLLMDPEGRNIKSLIYHNICSVAHFFKITIIIDIYE